MGQIVKRKKKGRPAKTDPGARELPEPERDLRRSLRRRNVKYVFDLDDYFDEDELFADDEDRRRREKKLKLLLKLQSGGETQSSEPQASRTRRVEHAPLASPSSSDDGDKPSKKRKIDEDMDDEDMDDENDDANDQDNCNDEDDEEIRERKSEPKAEDSPPGTPAEAPSGLPLPDKRTLDLILDKLQKKDIYGVYAEPVDPEEVGLYSDHSYARSLARFAATLGSVAWKVASKRIEQALPQGFKFGRGWVGEYEPLPTPVLMLENYTVKEPPFFAKVKPAADPRKFEKIPMVSVSSKESSGSVPFLEQKLPFLGPTGMRPPSASSISAQQIRGNSSAMPPSFFLSPGIKPSGTPNLSYQHQNLPSRASIESDKKVLKQVELNGPPVLNKNAADFVGNRQISKSTQIEASRCMEFSSTNANFLPPGSFKQPENNGVALGGLPDGKVIGNRVDSDTIAGSASDLAKPVSCYPHEQGQGLSDPVQLMRMLAEKAHTQQIPLINQSSADAAQGLPAQVLPSAPSLSSNDSNNAAVAAARAWMSVGAGGFRPVSENAYVNKNQIYADSLYNSTRDIQSQVSRFRGEYPASGVHVQPEKNGSPRHAFVPQGPIPMIVGSEMQFQNQRMVFPQFTTADLSRFQLQSTWQNISPQIHSRPKPESLPPDLNIGFQSSGSPGRPSTGVLVDSQQPDLALQL
ncbi:UNVERIFIED_CONTAM: hypothetical protein Sindi_2615800 [Sesamum indicum]